MTKNYSTLLEKLSKAKPARTRKELKNRIAELEIQLQQTLDNSISQASALRDRISELEAELSFYANCSYSSSWATGDKNHVMEDRGDRASNYLFGKAEPRKSCNTAIEALKEQGDG